MTLNERLGYNNEFITIWEKHPINQKDELLNLKNVFIKHVVKGQWEYKTKILRKNGIEIESTAVLIVPFNPMGKELFYEKGKSIDEVPNSKKVFKSISFEEITRLRRETIEWIIYI